MLRRDRGPPEITGGYPDKCPSCGAPDGFDCGCFDDQEDDVVDDVDP